MNQSFLRSCCYNEKQYISNFPNEPSTLLCELHFADKALLIGAKKVFNLKTKQEISD